MTTLADLLTRRAAETPDAPAVGDLTYAGLEALAAGVAGRLRRQGVRPGDRVGLGFGPSVEATVGIHGILRAGAVCVPLDPSLPLARRKALAADAGLWALVGPEPLGALPLVKALGKPGTSPAEPLPADAPACLEYTSGVRPRAAIRTQENLLTFVRWASDCLGLAPSDRVAASSLAEVLATAAAGAALVPLVAGPAGWLEEERVTVLFATPSVLGEPHPGVRLVVSSGEPLPVAGPDVRRVHLYGSVETGVVAWHEIPGSLEGDMPLGRPCEHAEVSVRDRLGQPAATGELWVRGPAVSPGYWRRPVYTARAFAGRWFRTGDVVRQDPDGLLHFLGRRDRRATIQGCRVEPGEVEAALMRHPDVKVAAVVVADGALHAFVAGQDLDGLDLRKHLVRRLPPVMVPKRLEILEDLPRTARGKPDRRALARRVQARRPAPAS